MSSQLLDHSPQQPTNTNETAVPRHAVVTQIETPVVAPDRGGGHFDHDFSRIAVHAIPGIQREASANTTDGSISELADTTQMLTHATSDHAAPLDRAVQQPLEQQFGHDLSQVRVYQGSASARAADQLGARAYTLGNRIFLGSEASSLSSPDQTRLLTHEAVHTVQQGGAPVVPHAGLTVSNPNDAAEVEARHIADSLSTPGAATPSRSLALRDSMRASPGRPGIARMVAPQVQRDLTDKFTTNGGEFKLNLKTESHAGAKSGMSGTIKFKANDKAPDSANIRLLQAVKLVDSSTGKDYVWTGGNANRNKIQTTANKAAGVEGGWGVDINPAGIAPRTAKGDAAISPYYRDYWPNAASSQDGSKKGKTVSEASLWDYPGWSSNCSFSFETVAKAADTGHVYGTVMWGFTISDAAKGTVDHERAVGRNVTLLTTDKAIEKFNEFYKNPGSSTAP